jgi:hypothetical protein
MELGNFFRRPAESIGQDWWDLQDFLEVDDQIP